MIKSEVERARREDEKAGRESMVDRARFFPPKQDSRRFGRGCLPRCFS